MKQFYDRCIVKNIGQKIKRPCNIQMETAAEEGSPVKVSKRQAPSFTKVVQQIISRGKSCGKQREECHGKDYEKRNQEKSLIR